MLYRAISGRVSVSSSDGGIRRNMNTQDFMNAIYDLIAQNPVRRRERDDLIKLVDHVDTERNTIVFINSKGLEFELRLVDTYAPSVEAAQSERTK